MFNCSGISVIVIRKYLHRAFCAIRDSFIHETFPHCSACVFPCSVICEFELKAFSPCFLQKLYAIWVINESIVWIRIRVFLSCILETHKMAVHLLFEMFLCVFDWKIRVSFHSDPRVEKEKIKKKCCSCLRVFWFFFFSSRIELLFQAAI